MGLKNWFAKNVAGPGAYGGAMGRSTAESGLALGRVLYLAHGTTDETIPLGVFDDAEEMKQYGYTIYCSDPSDKPPMEDKSYLSILTRAAGVAFAARLTKNGARGNMRDDNYQKFKQGFNGAIQSYLLTHSRDVSVQLVDEFINLEPSDGVTEVLNLDAPGERDLFADYLIAISDRCAASAETDYNYIGFLRRGTIGFDIWVTTLASETVVSIQQAVAEFKW